MLGEHCLDLCTLIEQTIPRSSGLASVAERVYPELAGYSSSTARRERRQPAPGTSALISCEVDFSAANRQHGKEVETRRLQEKTAFLATTVNR